MNTLPILGLVVSVRRDRCRYCGERHDVATVRRGRDWWEQESLCRKATTRGSSKLTDIVEAEVFGDGGAA